MVLIYHYLLNKSIYTIYILSLFLFIILWDNFYKKGFLFLYKVILLGNKNDNTITSSITRMLSLYGKTTAIIDGKIKDMGNNENINFVIYDTDSLNQCDTQNTIIVLKDQITPENIWLEKIKCPIIVNSANISAINILESNNIKHITCGMNQKDFVTCSSITDDNIVFDIHKKIIRLNGNTLQPMELPVKIENNNTYYLMAFFVILILCDMENLLLN